MIGFRWMMLSAALAVTWVAGCSDDSGPGLGDGELGYARFSSQCAGAGDVACIPERIGGFGRAVALTSTFEVSFVLREAVPVDAGWIELVSDTRAQVLSSNGNYPDEYDYGYGDIEPSASLFAREQGEITLMALAQDDTVADFVTLSLLPVTSLAVVRDCRENACDADVDGYAVGPIAVGETTRLRVEPYADGQLLVGNLDYTWQVSTPELATLVQTDGNAATLEPMAPGTVYVRVQGGGSEDMVAIEVTSNVSSEGPHRRPPGGSADSGGSTDGSGTDTDTGTDTGTGTGTTTGGM